MFSADEIANWFLAWAEDQDADISNLKMQKLVYYAQAHSLGAGDGALFADRIEAWAHGPVIDSLYQRFKKYGSGAIPAEAEVPDSFDWDTYRKVENLLMAVWETYGSQAAWALRNRTHREAPWIRAFDAPGHNVEISRKSMQEFFHVG